VDTRRSRGGSGAATGPGDDAPPGPASVSIKPLPATDRRHEKASKRARRRDWEWFARHPDRCFRVRRSLPFEYAKWGPKEHLRTQYMLVRASPDRQEYVRHGVAAKTFPHNDEAFLSRLWVNMQALAEPNGGLVEFDAHAHLAMLKQSGVVEG
jgi:hypothetical protein